MSCSCMIYKTSKLQTTLSAPTLQNVRQIHKPAVEVKQKARPAIHDDPTVPNIPAKGKDIRAPIVVSAVR